MVSFWFMDMGQHIARNEKMNVSTSKAHSLLCFYTCSRWVCVLAIMCWNQWNRLCLINHNRLNSTNATKRCPFNIILLKRNNTKRHYDCSSFFQDSLPSLYIYVHGTFSSSSVTLAAMCIFMYHVLSCMYVHVWGIFVCVCVVYRNKRLRSKLLHRYKKLEKEEKLMGDGAINWQGIRFPHH